MADIKFNCPSCKRSLEAPADMAGQLIDCPTCMESIEIPIPTRGVNTEIKRPSPPTLPPTPPLQPAAAPLQLAPQHAAHINKRGEFVGVGCLVQGLGFVLCFFFFPIGLVAGIIVLIIGGRLAVKLVCSACGNKIEDKGVNICPVCKAVLRSG